MEKNKEVFENMSIPKAVATMAIPTIISMIVTMAYNMADTYFIGQTQDAIMVSAVSLIAPIFTIFTAFANLFGIGGSTAISRAMGEKNDSREAFIIILFLYYYFLWYYISNYYLAWNEYSFKYFWCTRKYI